MEQSIVYTEQEPASVACWFAIKRRTRFLIAVLLVTALATPAMLWLYPRKYKGVVRLQLESPRALMPLLDTERNGSDSSTALMQAELIRSGPILQEAVSRMDLQQRWGTLSRPLTNVEAIDCLNERLAVQSKAGGLLIEIAVYDEKPQLAGDIANAIAEAFVATQTRQFEKQKQQARQRMKEAIAKAEQQLLNARDTTEKMRKELNASQSSLDLDDTLQRKLSNSIDQAAVDSVGQKLRLDTLSKLANHQMYGLLLALTGDPALRTTLQRSSELDHQIAGMQNRYGDSHPELQRIKEARQQATEELSQCAGMLLKSLVMENQATDMRIQQLQQRLAERQQLSLQQASITAPYRQAVQKEQAEAQSLKAMQERFAQNALSLDMLKPPFAISELSRTPTIPSGLTPGVTLTIAIILSLLLGVLMAMWLDTLDTSYRRVHDLQRSLHLPVLGIIRSINQPGKAAVAAEQYRMMRNSVNYLREERSFKSLCFLSAGAGEGKSFTLYNLAQAWAEQKLRVLIVDTDLQHPTMHRLMGVGNHVGLSDYLAGQCTVAQTIQATSITNISIISAGQSKSPELLASVTNFRQLIQQVSLQYDLVLYDTPPVLQISHATQVAREVGTAVLLVQHRRYPRHMVSRAKQMIVGAGTHLIGTVVNRIHTGEEGDFFGYHNNHAYYYRTFSENVSAQNSTAETRSLAA